MDLEIIKIASNTDNNNILKDYTHIAKHKNHLCGDEITIYLIHLLAAQVFELLILRVQKLLFVRI